MILYNHKKEFVGIDESDLEMLGFESLSELQNEVSDFADLFVKTPGHVHNFQHVHWLDFIANTDSIDENRAIIEVNGKNYKATLGLQRVYFADEPDKKGYGVILNIQRALGKGEENRFSSATATPPPPPPSEPEITATPQETTPMRNDEALEDIYAPSSASLQENDDAIEIGLDLDFDDEVEEKTPQTSAPSPKEDEALDLHIPQEQNDVSVQKPQPQQSVGVVVADEDDKFKDYHFDPEFAAKELGLPVDLVEEFIEDFIAQSDEFKPQLYEALDIGRMDQLRMLSHKLKGVAANLRIEDALDALITINTSDDVDLVKYKLDYYYGVIMKKLAGEEVVFQTPSEATPQTSTPQSEQTIEVPKEEESLPPLKEEKPQQPVQEEEEEELLSLEMEEEPVSPNKPQVTVQEEVQEEEEPLSLELDDEEIEPLSLDDELEPLVLEEPQEEKPAPQPQREPQKEEEELGALLLDEVEETPPAPKPQPKVEEKPSEPSLSLDDELESLSIDEKELESLLVEEESVQSSVEADVATPTASSSASEGFSIDKQIAAKELGLDIQTYEEMLGYFVNDAIVDMAQLQAASLQNNDKKMKHYALRLKGMSDNMHLKELSSDFEALIRGSKTKDGLIESIKRKLDSISRMV